MSAQSYFSQTSVLEVVFPCQKVPYVIVCTYTVDTIFIIWLVLFATFWDSHFYNEIFSLFCHCYCCVLDIYCICGHELQGHTMMTYNCLKRWKRKKQMEAKGRSCQRRGMEGRKKQAQWKRRERETHVMMMTRRRSSSPVHHLFWLQVRGKNPTNHHVSHLPQICIHLSSIHIYDSIFMNVWVREDCWIAFFPPDSPMKTGEKIWKFGLFKSQLPVTCGQCEGMLNKSKLEQGEVSLMSV